MYIYYTYLCMYICCFSYIYCVHLCCLLHRLDCQVWTDTVPGLDSKLCPEFTAFQFQAQGSRQGIFPRHQTWSVSSELRVMWAAFRRSNAQQPFRWWSSWRPRLLRLQVSIFFVLMFESCGACDDIHPFCLFFKGWLWPIMCCCERRKDGL